MAKIPERNTPSEDIARDATLYLQSALHHLSFHDADILPVAVDGIFDEVTRASLASFQRKYGLPVTGTADPETWEELREAVEESRELHSPTTPISVFPRLPEGYYFDGESSPRHIMILQFVLDELEGEYGWEEIEIDGVYGKSTRAAVADFQRKNGIPVTGNVDRTTWNALARQFNALESE